MLKSVLDISDEATLRIIHRRLVRSGGDDAVCSALLDMDDCTDILDRTDVEELKKQQDVEKRNGSSGNTFQLSYTAKARLVFPGPKAKPKAKATAKAKAAPLPPTFTFLTTQQEAKALLPPGASVWRARVKGGWMGHLPPDPRISSMFEDFESQGHALKDILQRLWLQYLTFRGHDTTQCPVVGLF